MSRHRYLQQYEISPAKPEDIPHLASIELSAATLLAYHAPPSVLEETTTRAEFELAQRESRLWVARWNDFPVGFAHAELLEPKVAHLKEIDVHPDHGRRGLGTQLVKQAVEWARTNSCGYIVLTTFRDPPFNMPFYRKLGFEIVSRSDVSPALAAIVADERRRGLDPRDRVAMWHRIAD